MNKTSYFPSKYHSRVFKIAVSIFFLLLILKLSGQDLSKPMARGLLPISRIDTTKPKVQYFLKLPYTQDQFRKKIDTIYQVTMQLGKSMTVDQSEQLKGYVLSVLNRLSLDAKIDSVKIK